MSEHYFLNFPVINYSGMAAVNIMARGKIVSRFKDNHSVFYDYKVPNGDRIEKVAYDLYGKVAYTWVIELFNDIFDPHFDWPLSDIDVLNNIKSKYGTVEFAQQWYINYRNNWYQDDTVLDPAGFEAIDSSVKKFWRPNIIAGNRVVSYTRAQVDTKVNTNYILSGNIVANSTPTTNVFANTTAGSGQVAFANATSIKIYHVKGAWANTDPFTVNGQTITWDGAITTTAVIPANEQVYYSPVSAFDQEFEKNEQKRSIRLVKAEYVPIIEKALKEVLHK